MIGDDGLVAEQVGLSDVLVHPRAAALGGPRVVIREEERQRRAVGVEHLEHAHVRLVHGQVVAFLERDAVEPRGGKEHAVFQDVVQLEIGTKLRLVEGIARLRTFSE